MPHIPSGNTILLDLIRFDDALAAAQQPSPDYDYQKWLYVPNVYSEYRYILGTRGKKPLICVGINPSTAAPDHLDNTDPDDMEQVYNQDLHRENLKAFAYALSLDQTGSPAVWCAWGAVIEKRDYLPTCVHDMIDIGTAYHAKWYCAGNRTKKGHPHHPLYLRKDSLLEEFDILNYLERF